MKAFKKYLLNKKIIITYHGFKGSWLTLWCILSEQGSRYFNKTISNPHTLKDLIKKILKVINDRSQKIKNI